MPANHPPPTEHLFRVGPDGKLRQFKVVLGVGSYVNLEEPQTGEKLQMQNRSNYRDTPEEAITLYRNEMSRKYKETRIAAKAALKKLAMLNRVRIQYTHKEEDLKDAEDRVYQVLSDLVKLRDASQPTAPNALQLTNG